MNSALHFPSMMIYFIKNQNKDLHLLQTFYTDPQFKVLDSSCTNKFSSSLLAIIWGPVFFITSVNINLKPGDMLFLFMKCYFPWTFWSINSAIIMLRNIILLCATSWGGRQRRTDKAYSDRETKIKRHKDFSPSAIVTM